MFRFICLLLLVAASCGCEPSKKVYPLPIPKIEAPAVNLPVGMRQENWRGKLGQGSCVYASLINHARWLNMPEFATLIRQTRGDGEYAERLMRWLDTVEWRDDFGVRRTGIDYRYTLKANPKFLDWCTEQRVGCILWWKPSHCCTFLGWVEDNKGNKFAAILDNNSINKIEYTPYSQFLNLWAGYGGFGLALLNDPAISIPYKSYELR